MVKRILFYLFITASLVAAVWAYIKLKESKQPKADVTEHISADALCVIQTKSAQELANQLTRQNLIWNSLLSEESIKQAHYGIRYLDSLLTTSDEVSSILENNQFYWSFYKANTSLNHLLQFKLKEQSEDELIEAFFSTHFQKSTSVSSFDAYSIKLGKNNWLACIDNGIVYFSSDLGILQTALILDKKLSLAANDAYLNLQKQLGEQSTKLYYNHKLGNLFDQTLFAKQSLFNAEVDLNEITLTGYTDADNQSFFEVLKNQPAERVDLLELLPQQPVSLLGVSVSDALMLDKQVLSRSSDKIKESASAMWQLLNDSAMYNIKQETLENLSGQLVLGNYWLQDAACSVTLLNVKDESKTKQLLEYVSDSSFVQGEISIIKLKQEFLSLLCFINPSAKNEYVSLIDQTLYFFSNRVALNYFTEANSNNKLLGKNSDFMDYAKDNLLSESNFIYYENCVEIKKTGFSRLINSLELNTGDEVLAKLSLTAKNFNNLVQVRINGTHAKETTNSELNSKTLWAFQADSSIITPVYAFTNHNTQENELTFQDNQNNMYLISSTGNLLWKKTINETIKSDVFTVDIFKNGKLQLLFNTDNYIHLIDRNGAYVQGFPVKMPSKITSNITMLDYDNNKDYRLFIACADKKIYNYTLYGVKTEGFSPVKTDATVNLPINYVRVGASDYLVTVDSEGKIYVFSRKGEGRIDFTNHTIQGLEHLYVLGGNNLDNTRLIYVDDKNNLLNKITFTDKKEVLKLGDELSDFRFSFDLINDDTQPDVLAYGNGALYAYDVFSSKLMEYFNEQAVYGAVNIVNTSNHQWLLATDKASNKIDLIANEGKYAFSIPNVTNKPLVLDLYKNGKTYVVSVGFNKINCQELN